MKERLRNFSLSILGLAAVLFMQVPAEGAAFASSWPRDVERVWVGPEFWANRLQDWRISGGRLECVEGRASKPMRTVHLLTHSLRERRGDFSMRVRTGRISGTAGGGSNTWTGFLIGAGQGQLDYRAAALVHHGAGAGGGIIAAADATGRAVFRDMTRSGYPILAEGEGSVEKLPDELELLLSCQWSRDGYILDLAVRDVKSGQIISVATLAEVSAEKLIGSVALVSQPGGRGRQEGARFWFKDFKVEGTKIALHNDRFCGPILSSQYTLSRGVLKMTAQMMPLGKMDNQTVTLQWQEGGIFKKVKTTTTKVIAPGWTAPFRVEGWDAGKDVPYSIVYQLKQADGTSQPFSWTGTVRKDPVKKRTIVVAGFTGNHNTRGGVEGKPIWSPDGIWFPHNEVVNHVAKHKPDVLFFSGDQVYEGNSPTGADRSGEDSSYLDYMYKWYLWCWAYRDLTKDIVTITMPDDHDVFQPNLWGQSGRKIDKDDKGGYVMPAGFVKMVERTQTSHLPDPYDPTPIDQGIGVYYTSMNYGRIDFAIIEDRKFKSGCNGLVPPTGSGRADHVIDPDFDVKELDVPGAKLLGDRQLKFLREWAANWQGVDMKTVVSQTVFAGMATHHGGNLKYLVADLDSNGWPQTGRNKALREMRRGFAFMIGGDQHLASIVHHGVDDFNDAGWSFTVPSVANFYPRAWRPKQAGKNRAAGMPDYTGEYLDGLGNHVTVWAATNPGESSGKQPAALHDKNPGYGIVRFDKKERKITMECWPRYADPANPATGKQYEGWPWTIDQMDNYSRKAVAYLPTLHIKGSANPVVQIISESDGQIVYTLRIKGKSFRPKVFKKGSYTIKVSDPDSTNKEKILKGIGTIPEDRVKTISVTL